MGNFGNRSKFQAWHARPDVLEIPIRLTGAGAAVVVDKDAGKFGSIVKSIVRDSAGLQTITLREKYQEAQIEEISVKTAKGTAGHISDVAAYDLDGTGATIDPTIQIRNVDAAAAAADFAASCDIWVTIKVRTSTRN